MPDLPVKEAFIKRYLKKASFVFPALPFFLHKQSGLGYNIRCKC